jgi:hypothetical protein
VSSTARGGKRSPADFYATPSWTVRAFLKRCDLPRGLWLEPCAGDGAIIKAVNEVRSDVVWTACELRPETEPVLQASASKVVIGDFLKLVPPPVKYFDVSITNYPFSIAMEMLLHNLQFSYYVVSLLRLNFFGSEKRNAFFQQYMPDVYVIPNRVSFAISVSCKKCDWAEIFPLGTTDYPRKCPTCGSKVTISTTDSIEYAWFVWGPDRERRRGSIVSARPYARGQTMKGGPKPIRLPADAVRELEFMANAFEREAKGWPKQHPTLRRWLEGVRRGLRDAAASCRRRAGRIRLAMKRQQERRDAVELAKLRHLLKRSRR